MNLEDIKNYLGTTIPEMERQLDKLCGSSIAAFPDINHHITELQALVYPLLKLDKLCNEYYDKIIPVKLREIESTNEKLTADKRDMLLKEKLATIRSYRTFFEKSQEMVKQRIILGLTLLKNK